MIDFVSQASGKEVPFTILPRRPGDLAQFMRILLSHSRCSVGKPNEAYRVWRVHGSL